MNEILKFISFICTCLGLGFIIMKKLDSYENGRYQSLGNDQVLDTRTGIVYNSSIEGK